MAMAGSHGSSDGHQVGVGEENEGSRSAYSMQNSADISTSSWNGRPSQRGQSLAFTAPSSFTGENSTHSVHHPADISTWPMVTRQSQRGQVESTPPPSAGSRSAYSMQNSADISTSSWNGRPSQRGQSLAFTAPSSFTGESSTHSVHHPADISTWPMVTRQSQRGQVESTPSPSAFSAANQPSSTNGMERQTVADLRNRRGWHGSDMYIKPKIDEAREFIQHGHHLKAFVLFKAARDNQKMAGRPSCEVLETQIMMAACQFKIGNFDQAKTELEAVLREAEGLPQNEGLRMERVVGHFLLALMYRHSGLHREELGSYQKALAITRQSTVLVDEMEPALKAYYSQAERNSRLESPSTRMPHNALEGGHEARALEEIKKLVIDTSDHHPDSGAFATGSAQFVADSSYTNPPPPSTQEQFDLDDFDDDQLMSLQGAFVMGSPHSAVDPTHTNPPPPLAQDWIEPDNFDDDQLMSLQPQVGGGSTFTSTLSSHEPASLSDNEEPQTLVPAAPSADDLSPSLPDEEPQTIVAVPPSSADDGTANISDSFHSTSLGDQHTSHGRQRPALSNAYSSMPSSRPSPQ